MNSLLHEYMEQRVHISKPATRKKLHEYGPVITISREYGCPAKRLAGQLSSALNRLEIDHYTKDRWSWVSKEILEESAKELNLKPELIRNVANMSETSLIDDILLTFGNKYYPGDVKIKKTIGEVIKSFAERGHVIIVGRAGASICHDIPRSLHIRLVAPYEFRVNEVSRKYMISLHDAEKKIQEIDKQRQIFRNHFMHKKEQEMFDVYYNNMTCHEEEIIQSIVRIAELRGFISTRK